MTAAHVLLTAFGIGMAILLYGAMITPLSDAAGGIQYTEPDGVVVVETNTLEDE